LVTKVMRPLPCGGITPRALSLEIQPSARPASVNSSVVDDQASPRPPAPQLQLHRRSRRRRPAQRRPVPQHFIRIQNRLGAHDLLNEYIRHIGSAIFAIPPAPEEGHYIGQALFT
jgi:hypothetical protein